MPIRRSSLDGDRVRDGEAAVTAGVTVDEQPNHDITTTIDENELLVPSMG